VDSTLALSLASLNTVLNACTNVLVSRFTYTVTDTNTSITATADNFAYADNAVVLASTHSTVVVTQPTGGLDQPYISLDSQLTVCTLTNTGQAWLSDGVQGQKKSIAVTGSGTLNVKGDNLPGSTTNYAMSTGDALILEFLGTKWREVMNDGATAT